MLLGLLRNHNYSTPVALGHSAYNILPVYEYISSHLEEKLDLKVLADIAGMSPNYFSTLFKKLNGITLWDYITAKRIENII